MSLPEGFQVVNQPKKNNSGLPEGFQVVQEPDKSMVQGVKEFFTGTDSFPEYGETQDYLRSVRASERKADPLSELRDFNLVEQDKEAGVLMFGDDADTKNYLQKMNPNLQWSVDPKSGREIFTDPEHGSFYVNKSSVGVKDLGKLAGQAYMYGQGGKVTGALKSVPAKIGVAVPTEMAIDASLQKRAGRENIDQLQTLIAGATGGAFEAVSPLISKVWRWARNSKAGNREAGAALAREMGAEGLTNKQVEDLGYYLNNLDESQVNKQNLLSTVELNQKPTRGSLAGDIDTLDMEKKALSRGSEKTKQHFRDIQSQNTDALMGKFDDMQVRPEESYVTTAGRVGEDVRNVAQEKKRAASEAWDSIPDAQANKADLLSASDDIDARFKQSDFYIDEDLTPAAYKAANKIREFTKGLETDISLGDEAINWKRINLERKRLGKMFNLAKTQEDKAALSIVKDEFEKTYKNAFEQSFFGSESMGQLDDAVKASKDYFDLFNPKNRRDAAGKAVQEWLDAGVRPETIAQTMFSKKGAIVNKTAPIVSKLKEILGPDSPEFQNVRELAIKRLFSGKDSATLKTSLRNALTDNPSLMNDLFDKKDLGFLSRTLQYLENLSYKKGDIRARSSGSTERYYDWLSRPINPNSQFTGIQTLIKGALGMLDGTERSMRSLPFRELAGDSLPMVGLRGGAITTATQEQ